MVKGSGCYAFRFRGSCQQLRRRICRAVLACRKAPCWHLYRKGPFRLVSSLSRRRQDISRVIRAPNCVLSTLNSLSKSLS